MTTWARLIWKNALEIDNIIIGTAICIFAAHAWITFYDGFGQIILYISVGIFALPSLASLTILTSAVYLTLSAIILLCADKPIARYQTVFPNFLALLAGFGVYAFIWIPADNVLHPNIYFCLLLVLLGTSTILISMIYLRRAFSVTPQARFVVSRGPYAWVRHPMYVGNIISILVLSMLVDSYFVYCLFAVSATLQVWRSKYEERLLLGCFSDYQQYKDRVGAFFPSISKHRVYCLLSIAFLIPINYAFAETAEIQNSKVAKKCSEWYEQALSEKWFNDKQRKELLAIEGIANSSLDNVKGCERYAKLDRTCTNLLFRWDGTGATEPGDQSPLNASNFIHKAEEEKGCVYLIGLDDICKAQEQMAKKGIKLSDGEKEIMQDCFEDILRKKRVQFLRPQE